ncbi:cytochrome P450 [Candidatus Litorirhabdus singularis]|nr:cytochrome P450 [Candidatus Litorirhabdus singularis]
MQCPHATLLNLANFEQGTPRQEIARLRKNHRLVWQEDEYERGGHWLVLQRNDIDTVLKTPADFTNNFSPLLEDFPPDVLAIQQESLTFMDPPRHGEYRSMADFAFRPKALRARADLMQQMATQVIDAVIDKGECEFVEEVAMQLPMKAIYGLLGVKPEDYQYVADITNTLALANDPEYAVDRDAGFAASMEAYLFGEKLAQDHRDNPRDSMTMDMLQADKNGRSLSNSEYAGFFVNLIVGGMETTRNTTAWLIYEFIRYPDQYALLQADPGLVTHAVEEILRYRNTVVYLRRTATHDMEFAGESVKSGDKLVCVLGSPSRSEEFFDSPDRFDITRDPIHTRRQYRTFGAGPHFCIGVHQARMMLELITAEIAARMTNLRLIEEPVHFRSNFMDGFKRMVIGFDKREG